MTNHQNRRDRGFTLVELLVVIGIIAVLISMLLPALQRAREAGKKAECASNERSIMQMMFLYAQSNNGYLPPYSMESNGSADSGDPAYPGLGTDISFSWDAILLNTLQDVPFVDFTIYGKQQQNLNRFAVFQCPDDDYPRDPPSPMLNLVRSYGLNESKWSFNVSPVGSTIVDGEDTSPYSGTEVSGGTIPPATGPFTGAPAAFVTHMPYSGGCNYGQFPASKYPPAAATGFDNGEYIHQCRISDIPAWIWVFGENFGQDNNGAFSYPENESGEQQVYGYVNPADGPGNTTTADDVIGYSPSSIMDGNPARFHDVSTDYRSQGAGGNYAFADGHVEFMRYLDVEAVRNLAIPGETGTYDGVAFNNNTVYGNHWYWWTTK